MTDRVMNCKAVLTPAVTAEVIVEDREDVEDFLPRRDSLPCRIFGWKDGYQRSLVPGCESVNQTWCVVKFIDRCGLGDVPVSQQVQKQRALEAFSN